MKKILTQLMIAVFFGQPYFDVYLFDEKCKVVDHFDKVMEVNVSQNDLLLGLTPDAGIGVDVWKFKEIHIQDRRGELNLHWNQEEKVIEELEWADCTEE